MSHPLAHWRGRYPILAEKTYLASHSLGAVPAETAERLARYYQEWATLGITAWDGPWWQAVLDFCADVERLLGAAAGTVVPFQNSTRGMAAVASCLDFSGERKRVVLTDLEFTSSYPFWRSCERLGAECVIVPSADRISVDTEAILAAIDERTLIVPTSHVYFRSGAVADLGAIAARCREVGAYSLGDGYQAVGAYPFSVAELGLDFYVGGCHKYLSGGAGAGFLYVRPELIGQLEPRLTGWFGLANPFGYEANTERGRLSDGVFRFLAGTPNVPGIYAAACGLANLLEAGPQAVREVSLGLTRALIDGAAERGLTVKTPTDDARRSGMVCIDFEGADRVCKALEAEGVLTDYRPDCGIRVSPHFYNTSEDIDRFWSALDAAR